MQQTFVQLQDTESSVRKLFKYLIYHGNIQSSLDISNTDISKYPLISKNIVWTDFLFLAHMYKKSCCLTMLALALEAAVVASAWALQNVNP